MNLADKMEIFNDIDDKYILESAPKRLLAYGATRNERIYDDRRLPLIFIETVMSVAAVVLVLGGIFIWTLVGKDLLKAGNSDDNESVTSVQENDDTPTSVYSEGLKFELNENNDSYKVVGIGECKDTAVKIPPTYNGKPVTEIGEYAFQSCQKIIKVNIPESVTVIGEGAFDKCQSLESVNLSSGIEVINSRTFYFCSNLKTIDIPEGVTKIGTYAFQQCSSLKEITLPKSVVSIEQRAFAYCSALEKITLNEGLEIISEYTFLHCESLKNFVIPSSVRVIESLAFQDCEKITDMTIPEGVTVLGDCIFASCDNLINVVVNANVKEINRLFAESRKVESIVLGEGIEVIGEFSKDLLPMLKQVVLPKSIRHIQWSKIVFLCGEITYNGTVAEWEAITKEYGKPTMPIPIHCIDGYLIIQ